MSTRHATRLLALLALLPFASPSRAEDRTGILEMPINWHMNPFQTGGYAHPQKYGYNTTLFKGSTSIVLEHDAACDWIDRAFDKLGFKMKRDVPYRRDGVEFVVTGYDAEKKIGYLWTSTEAVSDAFFGLPPEKSDEEKRVKLSAAEAKLLEDRAPVTREFIAMIIPYTTRLGYSNFAYRTDEEKVAFEKRGAETLEKRLAALDQAVGEYVSWVAIRRAEDYPAPSPEPRNLLTVDRWSACRSPEQHFGQCAVGLQHGSHLDEEPAKKSITSWGAEAKLDLTSPFTYEKNGGGLKITGYDPQRKIGYILYYAGNDAAQIKQAETLAAQAEADGLRIAWLSPGDPRFGDASAQVTRTSAHYSKERDAIAKITKRVERQEAERKLDEQIAREYPTATLRLERRVREFLEWTDKR